MRARPDGEGDAGLLGLGAVAGGDIGEQGAEIGRLAVEDEAARLGQREGPQVLDQPFQDPGLLEERLEMGGIGRIDAVEQGLEVALDHGERGAQLVGDIGQG